MRNTKKTNKNQQCNFAAQGGFEPPTLRAEI